MLFKDEHGLLIVKKEEKDSYFQPSLKLNDTPRNKRAVHNLASPGNGDCENIPGMLIHTLSPAAINVRRDENVKAAF